MGNQKFPNTCQMSEHVWKSKWVLGYVDRCVDVSGHLLGMWMCPYMLELCLNVCTDALIAAQASDRWYHLPTN